MTIELNKEHNGRFLTLLTGVCIVLTGDELYSICQADSFYQKYLGRSSFSLSSVHCFFSVYSELVYEQLIDVVSSSQATVVYKKTYFIDLLNFYFSWLLCNL